MTSFWTIQTTFAFARASIRAIFGVATKRAGSVGWPLAAGKTYHSTLQSANRRVPAIIGFPHRKETVGGEVAVVHPETGDGTMTVDVAMDDALPPVINLQDAVDGTIIVGGLKVKQRFETRGFATNGGNKEKDD